MFRRRLLAGAIALPLLVPVLAGCEAGNDAPTLQFHPAAAGQQTIFNQIRLSNVFVLAAPAGQSLPAGSNAGLFVGMYNDGSTQDTLRAVAAPGVAQSVTIDGGSIPVASQSAANLTGPEPRIVLHNLTKPLTGGQSVTVDFLFDHAGEVSMQVPVEADSYYYDQYVPAPTPTPTASPAGSAATSPSAPAAKSSAAATPSASAS